MGWTADSGVPWPQDAITIRAASDWSAEVRPAIFRT